MDKLSLLSFRKYSKPVAVYANTFDLSNIFNLDLLQNMSLHLKYIIFFI